jgi:zinc D-Ala-D-Ala dipeptidase
VSQEPRVNECGEPLVDVRKVGVLQLAPRLVGAVRLRVTVVDQLVTAQSLLSRDIRLLVLCGHHAAGPDVAERSCAYLHVTGGAADVSLCTDDGRELTMATSNRRALHQALSAVGMVSPPDLWWHWSYGDPYWCARTGAAFACYGPIPEAR